MTDPLWIPVVIFGLVGAFGLYIDWSLRRSRKSHK
jgi:hypothetical protein